MNKCPTCSLKGELSVCNKCNVHNCKDCLNLHNPSCSTIKKQKYNLCNQHCSPVVEYCCQCSKLTCNTCAESHTTHLRIPMKDAYFSIKEGISDVIDGLREKETQLKTFVENAGQKYELSTKMVEEEEKRWIRTIADVKHQLLVVLDNSKLRQDGKTLLHSLDGVKMHSKVLKAEQYPLTFLSKWSSVFNWIYKYEQWQTANRKTVDIKSGDQSVSQMFRTQILKCVGSTTDKPLKPVKVNDIDRISEKLSGVSIDDKSHSADIGQQQPNSAIEDEHVHVPNPNDRSDFDKDRRIKELKAEFSVMEESNKQHKIQIDCLENEIKSRNVRKEKIFEIVSLTVKWISEMTKSKELCQKPNSMVNTDDTDDLRNFKRNIQSIRNAFVDMKNELLASEDKLQQKIKSIAEWTDKQRTTSENERQEILKELREKNEKIIRQEKEIKRMDARLRELQDYDRVKNDNTKLRQQDFEHMNIQQRYKDEIQKLMFGRTRKIIEFLEALRRKL